MDKFKIYLAGGMSGLDEYEMMGWREHLIERVERESTNNQEIYFFSPPHYYNQHQEWHKSEREVMDYDLYRLRQSDLVIVNFNSPNSIGTAMELMLARELKIPIVGLNADKKLLHSWLKECCLRICDNFEELVEHIKKYYLEQKVDFESGL